MLSRADSALKTYVGMCEKLRCSRRSCQRDRELIVTVKNKLVTSNTERHISSKSCVDEQYSRDLVRWRREPSKLPVSRKNVDKSL